MFQDMNFEPGIYIKQVAWILEFFLNGLRYQLQIASTQLHIEFMFHQNGVPVTLFMFLA